MISYSNIVQIPRYGHFTPPKTYNETNDYNEILYYLEMNYNYINTYIFIPDLKNLSHISKFDDLFYNYRLTKEVIIEDQIINFNIGTIDIIYLNIFEICFKELKHKCNVEFIKQLLSTTDEANIILGVNMILYELKNEKK